MERKCENRAGHQALVDPVWGVDAPTGFGGGVWLDSKTEFHIRAINAMERENDRKYKVIALCGSTRSQDAFTAAQKRLTLEE